MKQSKLVLMVRVAGWFVLAVVLLVVLVVQTNPWWSQLGCNDAGYKEYRVFVDGNENREQWGFSSPFPSKIGYGSDADAKKLFDFIDVRYQYVRCERGFSFRHYSDYVDVVRFSLPAGIEFEQVDFDSYYKIWRKKLSAMGSEEWPPLMLYGAAEPHRDLKLDPNGSPRVWRSRSDDVRSYSEKISRLNVDWLKGESLGETQFMGLWHDGFLFRSKKEGFYIWIAAGV